MTTEENCNTPKPGKRWLVKDPKHLNVTHSTCEFIMHQCVCSPHHKKAKLKPRHPQISPTSDKNAMKKVLRTSHTHIEAASSLPRDISRQKLSTDSEEKETQLHAPKTQRCHGNITNCFKHGTLSYGYYYCFVWEVEGWDSEQGGQSEPSTRWSGKSILVGTAWNQYKYKYVY